MATGAPDGFGSRWRTVRGLRMHALESAGGLGTALIAELFRDWYAQYGRPSGRLLVSSFLLMDPVLAMRTCSVPYWALTGFHRDLTLGYADEGRMK